MPDYKVVYTFSHPSGGWTETFFDTLASPPTAQTLDPVLEFASVLAWRGGGVTLRSKKWIEEGGLRRSYPININMLSPRTNQSVGDRMEVAGNAIKVRLNFQGGGGRVLQVRGIADGDIIGNESGEPQVQGLTLNGIAAYIAYATQGADKYQGRRLLDINANPWKNVVNISLSTENANWTVVKHDGQLNPAVGDLMYFKGVDRAAIPWLGGVFRVVAVKAADNEFSIPTRYRNALAQTDLRNVQWRQALYEYPDLISGSIIYVGTRDTHSPFGRRRGARSRVRARL